MLIDWFTVAAQIVNFLILVFLLRKFLYGPITRAMAGRAERVANEMRKAREEREEAERRSEELEAERRELEEKRDRLMAEARDEVRDWKEQAMERARGEVDSARDKWREAFRRDRERDETRLAERLAEGVVEVSRKVLADLADRELEVQSAKRFLGALEETSGENGDPAEYEGELEVRTGFEPSQEMRETLEQGLKRIFPSASGTDFEHDESLGFGLRLLAGDRRYDWNLRDYLESLERDLFLGLGPWRESGSGDSSGQDSGQDSGNSGEESGEGQDSGEAA